ncbi:MAG: hypothetical protein HYU99_01585 [Deltaproteobacteria bacterium]|nr:hypothetical protein [Deltaproteobacteria bacterium]
MRYIPFLILVLFAAPVLALTPMRPESLPFDVKLAGQAPAPAGSVAKVSAPVPSDALLELGVSETEQVIVNFFVSDDNGIIKTENSSAKEIIMSTGAKTKINQTMSKNSLPPGTYLANIFAQSTGQTARIVFTVK